MILLAYRSCRSETTRMSPALMTFGRELDLPIDLIYGVPPGTEQPGQEPSQYVANLEKSMEKIHEIARKHMQKAADKQKREYDLKQYKTIIRRAILCGSSPPL